MGRTQRVRCRKKINAIDKSDTEAIKTVVIDLCKQLGIDGWRNQTRLQAHEFPRTGRGLHSKLNIRKDNVLINLPFTSLISLRTLETDSDFKEIFNLPETQKALSFQSLLAIYILFHRHKGTPKFRPYIETIPRNLTNPFFCTKIELNFLPDNILEKIVEQNQVIKASYQFLSSLCTSQCNCCNSSYFPDILDIDQFKWAYFAVNSRSVYMDPLAVIGMIENPFFLSWLKDDPKMALAPFLDLFNHSDRAATTSILTMDESLRYQLITHRPYGRYEQIFISYGDLSNLKLFVEYGFYIHDNGNDVFNIALSDIEVLIKSLKHAVHRNVFKFLKYHNFDAQMFVHCDDGASHNLQVALYLIFIEQSPFPNTLSQIAFGTTDHFEKAVQREVEHLVRLKVDEYRNFVKGLNGLEHLSESGVVLVGYLKECVNYLNKFLWKYSCNETMDNIC